jgi:glycosyltransferase involved in cell wall biosynthesis
MKILHVIPAFYPASAYGGTVEVAYQLSKELVRIGHDVTVYTSDTYDKYNRQKFQYSDIDGVKVYYFKTISNRLAWNHRIIFTPGMILKLREEIKKFDIIHLHGFRNILNVVTYYYAKKYRIPYVIHGHGDLPLANQKVVLKEIFDKVIGLRLLGDASRYIALNNTEAEEFKKLGAVSDKIIILPNGINCLEFFPLPKRGEFKKKYGIEDYNFILYLGRLNQTKGIDLLLNAFADLYNKVDHIMLLIIGPDDGYRAELERLSHSLGIADSIMFLGFIPKDEKISAFVDSDVFVTPIFYGFPVAFVEACACGTPIVTTNRGDRLDWIDGKVGFVTEYNKDELKNAIHEVITNNSLRNMFAENGLTLTTNEFNWNRVAQSIECIYADIMKHGDQQ